MNQRTGYSLLEVLVAFAVMSLVLAALVPRQLITLERASTTSQRLLAHDFARSILDAASVLGDDYIRDIDGPYRSWRVATSIQRDPGGQSQYGVRILDAQGRVLFELHNHVAPTN